MKEIIVSLVCMEGIHAKIFYRKVQALLGNRYTIQYKMCTPYHIQQSDIILLIPMLAYRTKELRSYVKKTEHIIQIDHYVYASLQPAVFIPKIEKIIQDIEKTIT